ncbi:unnamed protein product [Calypogeia fissa]
MGDLLCTKILTVSSKTATRPSLLACSTSHAHSPSSRDSTSCLEASKRRIWPGFAPFSPGAAVPLLFRGGCVSPSRPRFRCRPLPGRGYS